MKKSQTKTQKTPPSGRQTRPAYFDGFNGAGGSVNGGLGVIARRGWDPATSSFLENIAKKDGLASLKSWTETMPLRLLRILVETHEMAGMALSNDLGFTFRPGAMKLVAIKDYRSGKGTVDDSETQYLNRLWSRTHGIQTEGTVPGGQGGGMEDLQKTLAKQQTTDGMSAVECVIGDDGISDIIDFDPLSIRYADNKDGYRVAQQRQNGTPNGWKDLDLTTIRIAAWGGSRQNPYGSPRFGRFLGPGLADISEQRSLRDWLHSMAWPRIAFEFPIEQWVKFAQENPEVCEGMGEDGGDLTPTQWAESQVAIMKDVCASLTSSDFIIMASGGKAGVLNVSPGAGVNDLLNGRRLRVSQSLDHPPALLGITDGGTQAYATVQLRQYAAKLTAVASDSDRAVEWIGNVDLRARGVDMIAKVEREPIILTDALIDAQAREIEIRNGFALVDRGIVSPEQNAIQLSGSGLWDPSRAYTVVISPPATTTKG